MILGRILLALDKFDLEVPFEIPSLAAISNMCTSVEDKHVEYGSVHRWQTLHITNQFLVHQFLICFLAVVRFLPNPFRDASDFRHHVIFPQFVDGGIYYNSFDPGHQQSFRILLAFIPESFDMPEYFYKSVVGNIHRQIILVYIPERNF